MNPSAPPSEPPAPNRQTERLEALAQSGMRLIALIESQAVEGAVTVADAALAHSRVSRAVRMAELLRERLTAQAGEQARQDSYNRIWADKGAAERAAAAADPAHSHKARVEAIVSRIAKGETDDEDRLEAIACETAERLDDDDIYGQVADRPVGELVALICRDLGLDPDWERLGEEAWAVEEKAAAPPGSPFLAQAAAASRTSVEDQPYYLRSG
jgi:hypothetical protein